MEIAVICKEAQKLADALRTNASSPIDYPNPVSADILEKDKQIVNYPLDVTAIKIMSYEETFK